FDWIVAENGALLYQPTTKEERLLASRPTDALVRHLMQRGVSPIAMGRVIVATREPNETTVLDVIRDLGLELQVIFNKGAVMILPSGVNKATGLQVVLDHMNISARDVVGVGDAENDHAFLELCGYPVAVANALPSIKKQVALVTEGSNGSGVRELIHKL